MSLKKTMKVRKKAPIAARRAVSVEAAAVVELSPLTDSGELPMMARPTTEGVDLHHWLKGHRGRVREHQKRCGGVLLRGFDLTSVDDFEAAVQDLCGEDLAVYRDATTPRSVVRGQVYTSTDYPADQSIFFHSELAYSRAWPMNLLFFCQHPAEVGGETPIADTRRILAALDPEIRERFRRRRVLYVRNYGEGVGLDWRTVFKTEDRSEVESFCADAGIEIEWKGGDRLRTRAVRDAISRHPETGEDVWFNHVVLFHASNLDPAVRQALVAELGEDGLPHATFYGDGEPIEPEVIEHIREVTLGEAVTFRWRRGDLLLLDNMLTAHSRNPFKGERRLLTAMTEMYSR